jgi:asparagine synthase (glutamine-hydrolysing)
MRFLRAADLDSAEAHFTWNGTWLPAASVRFIQSDIETVSAEGIREIVARHRLPPQPSLRDLQIVDALEYLPNDILTKVDRMAMAFGLETRAPLLHPDIASFAFALPDRLKVTPFSKPKILLRHLAAQTFGPGISTAKKQGFSIPVHRWLRGPARHIAEDLLSKESLDKVPVLNAAAVTAAKDQHMSGCSTLGYELWGLMVLVAWFRSHVHS